jgi:hypothetical protein
MNNNIRYGSHEIETLKGSARLLPNGSDPEGESLAGDLREVAEFEFPESQGSDHQRRMPRAIQFLAAILLAALLYPLRAAAADLKPETVQAWQEYVKAAEARNQAHLASGSPFLSIDAEPAQAAKLRQGQILASPAAPNVPVRVQGGLIHDWTGAIFVPNASVPDILRVTRDYAQYKTVFHPNVVSAKPLETGDWNDTFSMVVMNTSFFAKSALDSDYRSEFTRLDDQRWYSTTETTRVQEVSNYGSPSEHMLPEGHGIGIIWSLYSFVRYKERDGGVYIELEAIALSRDIPAALRFVVEPIVRRVSKSSMVTSLQQTEDAVRSNTAIISRSTDGRVPADGISGSGVSVPTMRSFR